MGLPKCGPERQEGGRLWASLRKEEECTKWGGREDKGGRESNRGVVAHFRYPKPSDTQPSRVTLVNGLQALREAGATRVGSNLQGSVPPDHAFSVRHPYYRLSDHPGAGKDMFIGPTKALKKLKALHLIEVHKIQGRVLKCRRLLKNKTKAMPKNLI